MEIPGFDIYSFPDNPRILYAVKKYGIRIGGSPASVVVELIVRRGCKQVFVGQGGTRGPQFLIRTSAQGLLRPLGTAVVKDLRDIFMLKRVGDTSKGCEAAIEELSGVFGSLAIPEATVNARIPVMIVEKLEYQSKLGKRKEFKRAVIEMKPERFGYVVATAGGLKQMIKKLDKLIGKLQT